MRFRLTRLRMLAALAILLGGGAAIVGPVGDRTQAGAATERFDPAELPAVVRSFAAANGESNPKLVVAVETDRASALRATAPGSSVDDAGEDVYAVTATGSFIGYMAHVPAGQKPPTGTVLSLVVDAQTGALLDWGLDQEAPDLANLGTPLDVE